MGKSSVIRPMKTETRIEKRWEDGTPHHPKSENLYRKIAKLDYKFCGDSFDFRSGGDGDNGENLMYILDVIFDAEDKGEEKALEKLLR